MTQTGFLQLQRSSVVLGQKWQCITTTSESAYQSRAGAQPRIIIVTTTSESRSFAVRFGPPVGFFLSPRT